MEAADLAGGKLDALGSSAGEIGERETEGKQDTNVREKPERSGSVLRIMRNGANLHLVGIFSLEPFRSRRSPSKQQRDWVVSAPLQALSKQTQGRRGDGNKGVQI
jgi:hypothetical protein